MKDDFYTAPSTPEPAVSDAERIFRLQDELRRVKEHADYQHLAMKADMLILRDSVVVMQNAYRSLERRMVQERSMLATRLSRLESVEKGKQRARDE